MKRFVSVLLVMALTLVCALAAVSCGDSSSSGKTKIAIVQPMDHTSLNQIRDTIISTLKDLGYDDSNSEIILKNASNDASLLPSIFSSLVSENVDIIIPIGTGAAQVAASQTDTIPIVFAAVSDPVAAGLVTAFDVTDKNITGVSDAVDVESIFALAKELTPDAKTVGLVYNASEINSSVKIDRAKAYCDANGLSYKEATVTGTADVQQAVTSIASDVDIFFTPDDNTVASAMNVYAGVQLEFGKPIYCGADSMVKDGGFATVGIDYDILAKQVAEMADRILKGAKVADVLGKNEYGRRWRREADDIRDDVMKNGWKEEIGSFSQAYDNLALDSSLLLMEPYGFIEATDPRYSRTVRAVKEALLHDGLMYRYNSEDDFGMPASAFTICTFWLIRALFVIGEREEARRLFDGVLRCANHVGLFSEDIDFDTKELLGNFPQAYSHLALVNTAVLFAEEDRSLTFVRP